MVISGPPGSGKSTIASRAVDLLRERGEVLFGFTTTEIRRGGRRTGFVVTGVASGRERLLATTSTVGDARPRVGTYGVDVDAFEDIALIEIEQALDLGARLVVVVVGRMEVLSARFSALVYAIFAAPRGPATLPALPFELTDLLIRRPDVRTIGLPRPRRSELPAIAAAWVCDTEPIPA